MLEKLVESSDSTLEALQTLVKSGVKAKRGKGQKKVKKSPEETKTSGYALFKKLTPRSWTL